MSRNTAKTLLLFVSAALLSACGIKGDLDRPAPLWGSASDAQVKAGNEAADSDPSDTPATPQFDEFEDDEDEPGYGVDVAD